MSPFLQRNSTKSTKKAMEEKRVCQPCEEPVIDLAPACPLQCGSKKCKAYQKKPNEVELRKKKFPISACPGCEAPVDFTKVPIVWVLGGPGSGKGTQCEKIIAKYGFTHLSTGDLLREEVKTGSERAKTLTAIMERGELVPNDIVLDLLKEAMDKVTDAKGFLIDGYPREKEQGIAFENAIAPVTVIIYFEASTETLTKRLLGRAVSSGRADDNEDTIKLRLKTFLANSDKVLEQYPNKLQRINAETDVDTIFNQVQSILDPIAPVDFTKVPIVWILGGPGSGKGTQCMKIIARYGFNHLSTGDLLREEVKTDSERAKNLTGIMERGELVPNDIVLDLLKEAMERVTGAKGFLIDGYPREKEQGIAFEDAIAPVTVIIYFDASIETLTERLQGRAASSGRADYNEDTIKLRLQTFLNNNDEVLKQYPNKLQRINAEEDVETIFQEVVNILDPIAPVDFTKVPIVWILGGPGSGKRTQCKMIIEKYGLNHVSIDNLLRDEVNTGSDRGNTLTEIMDSPVYILYTLFMEQGDLVPNDVVLDLLRETMSKEIEPKGFLIDGYPREIEQGIAFEYAIAPVNVIIYFEASSETLTKRILNRAESFSDNEHIIKLRLKTFNDNNSKVLQQYPSKLKRINAEADVNTIFKEVQRILDPVLFPAPVVPPKCQISEVQELAGTRARITRRSSRNMV